MQVVGELKKRNSGNEEMNKMLDSVGGMLQFDISAMNGGMEGNMNLQ